MKKITKKYKEPVLFKIGSDARTFGFCAGNGSHESEGSCNSSGIIAAYTCVTNGGQASSTDCVGDGSVAVGNCDDAGGSAAS